MKQGELTTIDNLQVGDRFYFASDKKKEVWQVKRKEEKSNDWMTTGATVYKPEVKYSNHNVKKGRAVVFLRSTTQQPQTL